MSSRVTRKLVKALDPKYILDKEILDKTSAVDTAISDRRRRRFLERPTTSSSEPTTSLVTETAPSPSTSPTVGRYEAERGMRERFRSGLTSTGEALGRGAKATRRALGRGATATGRALRTGARATSEGLRTGTTATRRALGRGANALRGTFTRRSPRKTVYEAPQLTSSNIGFTGKETRLPSLYQPFIERNPLVETNSLEEWKKKRRISNPRKLLDTSQQPTAVNNPLSESIRG